jgi:catechol 2,3-dioxygenase-like lactoylglutathione lyase family enzyme
MKILRTTSPIVTVVTEHLEATVEFYEGLLGEKTRVRFKNPTGTLDLVLIGTMLVIGGSSDAIAARKELKATFIVDSLSEWHAEVLRIGGTIVEQPAPGPMSAVGPVGKFMFVQHPDGSLFEYFQPDA